MGPAPPRLAHISPSRPALFPPPLPSTRPAEIFPSCELSLVPQPAVISPHHSGSAVHTQTPPTRVRRLRTVAGWLANLKPALSPMKGWGLSLSPHHSLSPSQFPPPPGNVAPQFSLELYFCFLLSLFIALSPPEPSLHPSCCLETGSGLRVGEGQASRGRGKEALSPTPLSALLPGSQKPTPPSAQHPQLFFKR